MPKVSVIIPAYNHSEFIAAAIDSVLAQSYRDFEIIVVNDGSPDDTETILIPYMESGQIRYIRQENHGPAAARNRGVEAAEGEFIAFLDDDDQWLPDKLEWQLSCFDEADVVMVVGASLLQAAPSKQRWGLRKQAFDVLKLADFFRGNPVGSPGQALLRKSDLIRVGGYDGSIWGADDLDLWIRLSQLGEIRRYPRPCLLYRQHASNASMDFRRMGINTLKVVSRHIDSSPGQSQGRHRIHAYRFLFRYTGRKLLWEAARHWREGQRKEASDALKEVHRVFRAAILRDPKLAFSLLHAAIKTPWKLHKHRNSDYRRHRRSTLPCVAPCDDTQHWHFESSFLPLAPSPRLEECLLEGGEANATPIASIVIPFFNGRKWLPQIKEQVNKQTWNNIEVVLVNDGSTNIKQEELEDFFKDDSRYRIIFKQNSGAGAARNTGLKLSRGKYIFFYDIDDLLAPTIVEEAIQSAELYDADVVIFEYETINDAGIANKSIKPLHGANIKSKDKRIFNLADIDYRFDFSPNCWNKCYSRAFLIENQVSFSNTRSSNDFKFSVCSLFAAEKITYLQRKLYGYRTHNADNITSNLSKTSSDCLCALGEIVEFLQFKKLFDNKVIQKWFYDFARSTLYYNLKHDINPSNASCYADIFTNSEWTKPISPGLLLKEKNLTVKICLFFMLKILTFGKTRNNFSKKHKNLRTIYLNLKQIIEHNRTL
jgi:glycosyltransferase involved in cell wall biosynthesis